MHRTSFTFAGIALFAGVLGFAVITPAAEAATVIKNKTFTSFRLPAGAKDRVYEKCTFKGGSKSKAVLTIDRAANNIVFRDCVIEKGGGWNGVSINDRNGNIRNIKFNRCTFKRQGRMGIEITSRPTSATKGYRNINIVNSTFEPQGSEAVSYDGGAGARTCTFRNNTVKGAGVNLAEQWGAGFEVNGPSDFVVEGNRFYQCRDSIWNLQRHTKKANGWKFRNNILDASRHVQGVPMRWDRQVVIGNGVHGGRFANNKVTGDKPGGGVAWFGDCHNMNWSGTVWRDARGGGYKKPMAQEGSSNNRF